MELNQIGNVIKSMTKHKVAIGIIIIIFTFLVAGVLIWINISPGTFKGEFSTDPFDDAISRTKISNLTDYNFWYRANLVLSFISIFAAFLSSIFAAVTTNENAHYMKFYTIFLTAVVSSIVSASSTLRMSDNIEAFIKANNNLTELQYKYYIKINDHREDYDRYVKDKKAIMPISILKIQRELLPEYHRIVNSRMRAWIEKGPQPSRNDEDISEFPNNTVIKEK